MSLHYIDNEVSWNAPVHYGEWDSIAEAGGSTITREVVASFPGRGSYGLRVDTDVGKVAYVRKNGVANLAAGAELYLGFWLYVNALPAGTTYITALHIGGSVKIGAMVKADGGLKFNYRDDGGWRAGPSVPPPAASGRWLYYVLGIKRATTNIAADGWFKMYFNGLLVGSILNNDNFDAWNGDLDLRGGCHSAANDDLDIFLDEYKVAISYPEPYRPYQQGVAISGSQRAIMPALVGGYLRLRK